MNELDWILASLGLLCIGRGAWRGAVSQVFGIAGALGGFFLASHFYGKLTVQLSNAFPGLSGVPFISFIILFVLTWFCLGMIGFFLARLLHRGGLGFMDRLLGAIVGLGKALVLAIIIISILTFFVQPTKSFLLQSRLAPYVQEAARFVILATPESVQRQFDLKRNELKHYWLDRRQRDEPLKPPVEKEVRLRQ